MYFPATLYHTGYAPVRTCMVMLACPAHRAASCPVSICLFAAVLWPPFLCSHYVCVPQGMLPSDVLMTSPVIQGEGGAPVTHFSEFGGIDPTMDPELAAVRSSVSIVCTSIVVFLENNPLVPCEWFSTLVCIRLELVFVSCEAHSPKAEVS